MYELDGIGKQLTGFSVPVNYKTAPSIHVNY